MKKSFSLGLILLFFFAMGIARCEDSFYIGTPYYDTKNKMTFPASKTKTQEAQPVNDNNKKKSKKNSKSNKEKKQKRFNPATNKTEVVPKGYYGSLPDIEQDFKYKKSIPSPTSSEIDAYIPKENVDGDILKEAPVNDTLFLDVIVKKEKPSNYINDIQKTKFALNNLKKCIEENGDIQRFNGCINMVDLYSKNLQEKYKDKSDSLKESYIDILNTSYHAKLLGNLLYEANYYSKYIPTETGKYSKSNIDEQKQALLKRVNKTLFIITNES